MSNLPAARVVSNETGPLHTPLLGPLAIVLAVLGTASIVLSLRFVQLYVALNSSDDRDTLSSQIDTLGKYSIPIIIGCEIALAVVTFLVSRRMATSSLRFLALATFAVMAANSLISITLSFAQFQSLALFLWEHRILYAVVLCLPAIGIALMLLLLHKCTLPANRTLVVWLGVAALGIKAVFIGRRVLSTPSADNSVWSNLLFSEATFAIAALVAAWIAWRNQPNDSGLHKSGDWAPAARGLRLYELALLWRLILTISGTVLLFMAVKGHSMVIAQALSWLIPLMGIITGALMTLGVFRFSNQPQGKRSSAFASLAGVMMAVSFVIDLALFIAIRKLIGLDTETANYGDSSDARGAVEAAISLVPLGLALSLVAFIVLLLSFHHVAKRFEDTGLTTKTINVGVCVAVFGAVTWGLRYWLSSASGVSAKLAISFGVVAIIAVVLVVLSLLNLVEQLRLRLAFTSAVDLGHDDDSYNEGPQQRSPQTGPQS